jgi:signal peptide peptidase SppA
MSVPMDVDPSFMTPFLAQRFLNVPLLLEGRRAATLLDGLRNTRAAFDDGGVPEVYEVVKRPDGRSYELVDGIAIVPVRGILVHGPAWAWAGESSYDDIRQMVGAAITDEEATAIALHIDSPGGEVAGCFDLADAIYGARQIKPIYAVCDECAFSAAYALASAASTIFVPRTGGVGSVGVIALRVDITGALAQMGIKITTLAFGDRKTDTYPTTALSAEAEKRLQSDIDELGEIFLEIVARNRGIEVETVRKLQAGTFLGQRGVNSGLADAILTPDEAFLMVMKANPAISRQ